MGGGIKEFVVPHPPPSVIDTKGATGLGDKGIDAAPFLNWAQDYHRWWSTQSYGPLGGLIEPSVSVIDFILLFKKKYVLICLISICNFDNICFILTGWHCPAAT